MRVIDIANCIEIRERRRFLRRYNTHGPNYLWCLDKNNCKLNDFHDRLLKYWHSKMVGINIMWKQKSNVQSLKSEVWSPFTAPVLHNGQPRPRCFKTLARSRDTGVKTPLSSPRPFAPPRVFHARVTRPRKCFKTRWGRPYIMAEIPSKLS